MNEFEWFVSEVPTGLEVRQIYGFIFSPDGRILLLDDSGLYNLPGGKPEIDESFAETLIRESEEEVQVTIVSIRYLGYQLITFPEIFAQVRLVALIDQVQPSVTDPSTGRQYGRIWTPPPITNELLNWGASGEDQVACAVAAVSKLGVTWDGAPLANIDIS